MPLYCNYICDNDEGDYDHDGYSVKCSPRRMVIDDCILTINLIEIKTKSMINIYLSTTMLRDSTRRDFFS